MTDTTRPEIERWDAENPHRPDDQSTGEFVYYEDHVQALIRAQIAALEILAERWSIRSCSCGIEVERKIADLRKELEG